ncbi:hypothetical protein LIA77_06979 [Sarocladium implicatum]|nr:hypothetical protein LIA77_06979 [Sarocladium implicatum]
MPSPSPREPTPDGPASFASYISSRAALITGTLADRSPRPRLTQSEPTTRPTTAVFSPVHDARTGNRPSKGVSDEGPGEISPCGRRNSARSRGRSRGRGQGSVPAQRGKRKK